MVDLQWHDACSASRAFTAEEKAAGWPADMTPAQLAAMQRPAAHGDSQGRRAQWALRDALTAACEAGELVHVAETVELPAPEPDYFESGDQDYFGSAEWRARDKQKFMRQW